VELKKGYRDTGASVGATNQTPQEVAQAVQAAGLDTGPRILPMLCGQSIDADTDAEFYLGSMAHSMQEKFDRERRLVLASSHLVVGVTKEGKPKAVPQHIAKWLKAQKFVAGLDGEMFGDRYVVYDIFMLSDKPLQGQGFSKRWAQLCKLVPAMPKLMDANDTPVVRCQTWTTPEQKRAAFAQLRADEHEGVIFRLNNGVYTVGRSDALLKCKFTASATFIVRGIREKGQNSMRVGLWDWPGFSTDVSLIGRPEVKIGDRVECTYLYAHNGKGKAKDEGAMSQARWQPYADGTYAVRDDVRPEECVRSQLKFKREED
jgi:hypothetical protein